MGVPDGDAEKGKKVRITLVWCNGAFQDGRVPHIYFTFYSLNPATWGHSPKDIEHVKIQVT